MDDAKMQNLSESDVEKYFEGIGVIESIDIPRDHITMKPKGYVIVEFSRDSEAKEAVSYLNGFEIDGKKISVQIWTEYLEKTISQLESKKGAEGLDNDTGASYIHTQAARGILMQKLMEGRNLDMDQMGMG